MIDIFNSLEKEVDKGIIGGNNGISLGLPGLDRYISIRKRIYTLIFGSSGTGKSSLANCLYILNPFDWYWKNRHNTKIKLKIVSLNIIVEILYVSYFFMFILGNHETEAISGQNFVANF